MNKTIKILTLLMASFAFVLGTAFASPITVEDVSVQSSNGNYVVLVTMNNQNAATGTFVEPRVTINELGTSKLLGVEKVDQTGSEVFTYDLRDVTDSFGLLKQGETYTLTVEADGTAKSTAFLFGSVKDTTGLGLVFDSIELNSQEVSDITNLQVLNGQTLDVRLVFTATENFDNARLNVFIEGYEHSSIMDSTEIFSVISGKTYVKTLSVNLPADMRFGQDYKLRITGANDLSGLTYKDLDLYVDTQRNRIDVLDLVMTPSSGVEPGQNVIASVRMQNRGQKSQDSVRVSVSIPELNIVESSYVSNLNTNQAVTSDDMLLLIPQTAKAGQYSAVVTLAYNDGYTATSEEFTLNVLSPRVVQEQNLLVSFGNNVDLVAGESTSFEVVVANPNSVAKPISLAPVGVAWANVEVSPSLAMVGAGSDAKFTVTVTPKDSVVGENSFNLAVKEGTNVVSDLSVNTYVEGSSDDLNLTNIVLIALLILAIIILLVLVMTIARRRKDTEEETSSEEYY